MRLDSLDKAAVVSPSDGLGGGVEETPPKDLKPAGVKAIAGSAEDSSSGQSSGQEPRLAKIISLIEEAERRKRTIVRNKYDKQGRLGIVAAYQRVVVGYTGDITGESLDKRI